MFIPVKIKYYQDPVFKILKQFHNKQFISIDIEIWCVEGNRRSLVIAVRIGTELRTEPS